MKIEFEIPDDSDELQELQDILEGEGVKPLTASEYCGNIVNGYLTNRVRNIFIGHVSKQNTEVLKEKFGSLSKIKIKENK